ncbi:putative lipoprotein [Rhodovulum sp. P5]|nr:putative lipoprotein [Rhodovulum sp. P5]
MIASLLLLAACGGGSAPRNLDNACAIASDKPGYMRAMKRSERRWGVPVHVQMAVIHQESKFDRKARTPYRFVLGVIPMGRQSSAYGYAQVIDSTWDDYRKATKNRGASRTNFKDATDFMGWYMTKSRDKLGIPLSDARNQYLAYHEGQAGYARGSHYGKSWLLAVADRVALRAQAYKAQLVRCR